MTYEAVVNTIENIRRFGSLSGVQIMTRMLESLENPQEGMRMIHVAGTNGKGSVSAFLCEILREAGLRVGVFTSPHLEDFRERICINGEMIAEEKVRELGEYLLGQDFGVYPTMFDYCLAMALLYFKEEHCDVVILETGLGGRLDSTNAVGVPEVSVITKIGYDHMAILGETLPEIAAEKAGIIKKGTTVVMESQEEEVLQVFLKKAEQVGTLACHVIRPAEFLDCRYEDGRQIFSYGAYDELHMRMLGVHQYENAAAAIVAAEGFLEASVLRDEDGRILDGAAKRARIMECVRAGVGRTTWKGRMEILRTNPFLMVDGAHNSNGVTALRKSLEMLFPGEKFHFIMGVMADKDYEKMIEELLPFAIDFKTVTVESERAMQARELADCIGAKGVPAESAENLRECLSAENGDTAHKTIAFGSLYFVGEIEALLHKYYNFMNFA